MQWIEFLNDNMIEFVSSGPLTTRNHVEIKCPLCGDNDPSLHLGINLLNDHWYCWRDKTHRGSKPEFLISRLLGVGASQARLLVAAYQGAADDFGLPVSAITPLQPIQPVTWPTEFEPLTDRFISYLEGRGFDQPKKLAVYYNLECCQVGRWKQRLIIPVLDKDRNILGWQGRVIVKPKIAPRYLTSHQQVKRSLFNLQNLGKGGEVLFVCEGPIDAIKIDWFGKPKFRATCTFGSIQSMDQILQLSQFMPKFKRIIILLDNDSAGLSGGFNLSDWLPGVQLGQYLPDHDPGQMTKLEIRAYLNGY